MFVSVFVAAGLVAQSANLPKPQPGLHVSIVLFSGREDPKFVITAPREIAEVLNSVRGLQPHASLNSTSSLPHPMFGFRGVIGRNFSNQNPELGFIHVYENDVQLIEKLAPAARPVKSFRLDYSRNLEDRLISMARSRGVFPPK